MKYIIISSKCALFKRAADVLHRVARQAGSSQVATSVCFFVGRPRPGHRPQGVFGAAGAFSVSSLEETEECVSSHTGDPPKIKSNTVRLW